MTIRISSLLCLLFFLHAHPTFSQISTSFYINQSNAKIGVGHDFNEKLQGEFRMYSGTSVNNFTPEAVVNYNVARTNMYEAYAAD